MYWADLGEPFGSGPGYRRPVVIIQNNLFNESRLRTVIVCALTSNLRAGDIACNVSLKQHEANLPKASVIDVTEVITIDRQMLDELIGQISSDRLRSVLQGLQLITDPREPA